MQIGHLAAHGRGPAGGGATLESKRDRESTHNPSLAPAYLKKRRFFTEEQGVGGRGGFESIGDGSMPPDAAVLAAV